jgi:DNA polymerase V
MDETTLLDSGLMTHALLLRNQVPIKLTLRESAAVLCPLVTTRVFAGFPSPAEDWTEGRLDLNEYLITHPNATYYVRVAGDSMSDEICEGDLLVVDRACEARDGDIVVARVATEFTVKRLRTTNGQMRLEAANPAFSSLILDEDSDVEIWGKVLWSIRRH